MILELGDGRTLQLPDEMDDEQARQLKALILALEQRAMVAEADVRMLRDEMLNVRSDAAQFKELVAAMREMHAEMRQSMKELTEATLADRVVVADETGEYTRSKADIRRK